MDDPIPTAENRHGGLGDTPGTAAIVVRTPDELLAAMPHMLGFNPNEDLVLVPVSRGLPMARVDLPRTGHDRAQVMRSLSGPYGRNARPGAMVALVCVTEDRRSAELTSQHVAAGLEEVGVAVPLRIWASDERWLEFNSGDAGNRSTDTANRISAETVMAGRARPSASREALSESLLGDRVPVARLLPVVRAVAEASNPVAERRWALVRIKRFQADGNRLSDHDATRMLVALQSTKVRDALWEEMNRENATEHNALWTDLTRRAPDEVRTPAATLLAFSSWLGGNGAKAWCALDQIPDGPPYTMAALVATVLQEGVNPAVWERMRAPGTAGEAFTPPPPGHRHGRAIPGDGPDRPVPPVPGRGEECATWPMPDNPVRAPPSAGSADSSPTGRPTGLGSVSTGSTTPTSTRCSSPTTGDDRGSVHRAPRRPSGAGDAQPARRARDAGGRWRHPGLPAVGGRRCSELVVTRGRLAAR